MTPNQIMGPLQVIVPMIAGVLVGWGLDDTTAGLAAGGTVMLLAAAMSFLNARRVTMAKQVVAAPGVQVVVAENAPVDMKAAAADPRVSGIVAARK